MPLLGGRAEAVRIGERCNGKLVVLKGQFLEKKSILNQTYIRGGGAMTVTFSNIIIHNIRIYNDTYPKLTYNNLNLTMHKLWVIMQFTILLS